MGFFKMTNESNVEKMLKNMKVQRKEDDNKHQNVYYLFENIEKYQKPYFLREYQNIKYSNDFPDVKYEEYINNYYDKFFEEIEHLEEMFTKYHMFVEWLTISSTKLDISYVYLTSKLQMTGKSELESKYSVFIPQDLTKTESAVEIFANSKAIFKNCYFKDSPRTAVIIRDFSTAIFDHCIFENNNISCFLMNDSYAEFIECKFKNDKYISIFNSKNSHCKIINCHFYNLEGKSIFAKDESVVYIKDTTFENCKKGAATIAEKSKIIIDGGVEITNSSNTALRSISNSIIKAHDLKIKNTKGNGINIEDSTGYFINCEFDNTEYPTIAIIGRKSNPIFNNCNLYNNKDTFCVICKNGCRPLFDDCKFYDCKTNCFSISDFSQPHIQNCTFQNIDKYYMNVFGGSHLTFDKIKTNDNEINIEEKICVRNSSKCEKIKHNKLYKKEDKIEEKEEENIHCKSWMSPSYKPPEKIKDIKDPQIIKQKNLHHLKTMKLEDIQENALKQETSFKCCHCHKEMNEEDKPNILTPCGHLVCNNCKDIIERCPICDTPVNKVQRIFFEEVCALCLDNKPNTISLPCGHMCMCYECAMQNSANGYNCPLCNEPMTNFKFIFDDNSVNNHHFFKNVKNKIKKS